MIGSEEKKIKSDPTYIYLKKKEKGQVKPISNMSSRVRRVKRKTWKTWKYYFVKFLLIFFRKDCY